MTLLQMSFSGGVLILAILLIRAVGRNLLPKKVFPILWEVSLLRLLLPFSIPSIFSAYSLLTKSEPLKETINGTPLSQLVPLPQADAPSMEFPVLPPVQVQKEIPVLFLIWAVGALLCLLYFTAAYLHCRLEFCTSLPVQNAFAEKWLDTHSLRRPLQIRQSDRIAAPLTYGIFHPVILTPKHTDWSDQKQMEYVLSHEYIHICRFDALTKLIAAFTLCIHWFNPLVWVMYLLFNRDIELSCDERLIHQHGESSKSAYALTLISLEEKKSGLMPLCNNFSRHAINERITSIMKTKKVTAAAAIVSIVLLVSVVLFFATSASAGDSDSTEALLGQLTDYLVSRGVMQEGMTTEEGSKLVWDPDEEKELELEGASCYGFGLRFSDDEAVNGIMAGRLVGNYAISVNGLIYYYYDQAAGSWYAYDSAQRIALSPETIALYSTAAFIRGVSEDYLTVDMFECITDDNAERIKELNLTEDDLITGYYFNNPNDESTQWTFADDATFLFIDWNADYTDAGYPQYYLTTDKKIFLDYLESYAPEYRMPFFFLVENGVIRGVLERPMP